jgi:hypothetical protein
MTDRSSDEPIEPMEKAFGQKLWGSDKEKEGQDTEVKPGDPPGQEGEEQETGERKGLFDNVKNKVRGVADRITQPRNKSVTDEPAEDRDKSVDTAEEPAGTVDTDTAGKVEPITPVDDSKDESKVEDATEETGVDEPVPEPKPEEKQVEEPVEEPVEEHEEEPVEETPEEPVEESTEESTEEQQVEEPVEEHEEEQERPEKLRTIVQAENPDVNWRKAKNVMSALATTAGDTTSKGWDIAQGLVKMCFTQPHAISGTSRAIGLALASVDTAADLGMKAAKQYGVNIDNDQELKEDILKVRLYKRAQKRGENAVGNTFRTIAQSLNDIGVDDIRKMTPEQLSKHISDMEAEHQRIMDGLNENKSLGYKDLTRTQRRYTPLLPAYNMIVSKDRGLLIAEANHLQDYMKKLSTQAKNLSAADAEKLRAQRAADRARRMRAFDTLADGSPNPWSSILRQMDPKFNTELDPSTGLPVSPSAINRMIRTTVGMLQKPGLSQEETAKLRKAVSDLTEHARRMEWERREGPLRQHGEIWVRLSRLSPGIANYVDKILDHGTWPSDQPTQYIRAAIERYRNEMESAGNTTEVNRANMLLTSLNQFVEKKKLDNLIANSDSKLRELNIYHANAYGRLVKERDALLERFRNTPDTPENQGLRKELRNRLNEIIHRISYEKTIGGHIDPSELINDQTALSNAYEEYHKVLATAGGRDGTTFRLGDPSVARAYRKLKNAEEFFRQKYNPPGWKASAGAGEQVNPQPQPQPQSPQPGSNAGGPTPTPQPKPGKKKQRKGKKDNPWSKDKIGDWDEPKMELYDQNKKLDHRTITGPNGESIEVIVDANGRILRDDEGNIRRAREYQDKSDNKRWVETDLRGRKYRGELFERAGQPEGEPIEPQSDAGTVDSPNMDLYDQTKPLKIGKMRSLLGDTGTFVDVPVLVGEDGKPLTNEDGTYRMVAYVDNPDGSRRAVEIDRNRNYVGELFERAQPEPETPETPEGAQETPVEEPAVMQTEEEKPKWYENDSDTWSSRVKRDPQALEAEVGADDLRKINELAGDKKRLEKVKQFMKNEALKDQTLHQGLVLPGAKFKNKSQWTGKDYKALLDAAERMDAMPVEPAELKGSTKRTDGGFWDYRQSMNNFFGNQWALHERLPEEVKADIANLKRADGTPILRAEYSSSGEKLKAKNDLIDAILDQVIGIPDTPEMEGIRGALAGQIRGNLQSLARGSDTGKKKARGSNQYRQKEIVTPETPVVTPETANPAPKPRTEQEQMLDAINNGVPFPSGKDEFEAYLSKLTGVDPAIVKEFMTDLKATDDKGIASQMIDAFLNSSDNTKLHRFNDNGERIRGAIYNSATAPTKEERKAQMEERQRKDEETKKKVEQNLRDFLERRIEEQRANGVDVDGLYTDDVKNKILDFIKNSSDEYEDAFVRGVRRFVNRDLADTLSPEEIKQNEAAKEEEAQSGALTFDDALKDGKNIKRNKNGSYAAGRKRNGTYQGVKGLNKVLIGISKNKNARTPEDFSKFMDICAGISKMKDEALSQVSWSKLNEIRASFDKDMLKEKIKYNGYRDADAERLAERYSKTDLSPDTIGAYVGAPSSGKNTNASGAIPKLPVSQMGPGELSNILNDYGSEQRDEALERVKNYKGQYDAFLKALGKTSFDELDPTSQKTFENWVPLFKYLSEGPKAPVEEPPASETPPEVQPVNESLDDLDFDYDEDGSDTEAESAEAQTEPKISDDKEDFQIDKKKAIRTANYKGKKYEPKDRSGLIADESELAGDLNYINTDPGFVAHGGLSPEELARERAFKSRASMSFGDLLKEYGW